MTRSIILSLLAGLILTVAVAWWCTGSTQRYSAITALDLIGVAKTSQLASVGGAEHRTAFGYTEVAVWGNVADGNSAATLSLEAGWPFRCLRAQFLSVHATPNGVPTEIRFETNGLRLPEYLRTTRALRIRPLPLIPMPLGFLADLAFYTAVAWLALGLPREIRRAVRRARRLCVKCGYPLSAGGACAECGSHVRTGNAERAMW